MATKKKSPARAKPRSQPKRQSPGVKELLLLELQEIYAAENQLARTAPRFIKAAQAEMLKAYLHRRLETGSQLIEELNSVFEELEQSPARKKNVAADGLLNDLREHMQGVPVGPARDAVVIAGAQKIEHYCIAAWGTSRALAEALGIQSVTESMSRALDEGRDLDRQLTELAKGEILPGLVADAE
jgi:ferritin-like metal-binding protein YciE